MKNFQLTLDVSGATEQELKRGITAALEFFLNADVHPFKAGSALFKLEGDQAELTDEESRLLHLWFQATDVALEACCQGWRTRPEAHTWTLGFTWDREESASLAAVLPLMSQTEWTEACVAALLEGDRLLDRDLTPKIAAKAAASLWKACGQTLTPKVAADRWLGHEEACDAVHAVVQEPILADDDDDEDHGPST